MEGGMRKGEMENRDLLSKPNRKAAVADGTTNLGQEKLRNLNNVAS